MRAKITPRVLETALEADEDDSKHHTNDLSDEIDDIERNGNLHDFIILELGVVDRLPSLVHYVDGMLYLEEAVTERFGASHVERAIDIVFELIENKDNAGGLGDEGDSYAPW